MLLVFGLLVGLSILFLSGIPKSYPLVARPIPPPPHPAHLGGGLEGFDSPYLGHTGSWDGKGGAMFGASKTPDMDKGTRHGFALDVHAGVLARDGAGRAGRSHTRTAARVAGA